MRPLGPSTPPAYFRYEEMVLEMSIAVNMLSGDPAAYPGTGI
jgi:hypothetical protein